MHNNGAIAPNPSNRTLDQDLVEAKEDLQIVYSTSSTKSRKISDEEYETIIYIIKNILIRTNSLPHLKKDYLLNTIEEIKSLMAELSKILNHLPGEGSLFQEMKSHFINNLNQIKYILTTFENRHDDSPTTNRWMESWTRKISFLLTEVLGLIVETYLGDTVSPPYLSPNQKPPHLPF
jgi:hypothetical protein